MARPHYPLKPAEREQLMATARPRTLPLAPHAQPARRHLPLAAATRSVDSVRPIYAVWEITLACKPEELP